MTFFTGITTEKSLKEEYRKLVKRHHPDIGGNKYVMQMLVEEYRRRVSLLNEVRDTNFSNVKLEDKVFVNGTRCTVVSVQEKTFVAQADGRSKRASFSKIDGVCITNKKFKAYYKK